MFLKPLVTSSLTQPPTSVLRLEFIKQKSKYWNVENHYLRKSFFSPSNHQCFYFLSATFVNIIKNLFWCSFHGMNRVSLESVGLRWWILNKHKPFSSLIASILLLIDLKWFHKGALIHFHKNVSYSLLGDWHGFSLNLIEKRGRGSENGWAKVSTAMDFLSFQYTIITIHFFGGKILFSGIRKI